VIAEGNGRRYIKVRPACSWASHGGSPIAEDAALRSPAWRYQNPPPLGPPHPRQRAWFVDP